MMIKLTPVHALVTYKFPKFAEFNERSKSMQIYRQKQIRNLHTLLQENLGHEEFQKCSFLQWFTVDANSIVLV